MPAPRSRRLRNQTAPVVHSKRDWTFAVGGSALVVLATAFLIWAMRPGDVNSFTPGKGGIIHRQPKVALWLLATAAAIGIVTWLVLRHESKVRKPLRALLLGISAVVVVSVAALGVWHNSLVHDYAVPTTPTTPTTPPTSVPPLTTTTPGGATTTPKATTPTTAPSTQTTTATPTTAATATTAAAPSTTGG